MKNAIKIPLIERAIEALAPLEACCTLCPRNCRVDRRKGEKGVCGTGSRAGVSSALLHFGEEPVLSGFRDYCRDEAHGRGPRSGSGTIFFTGCNLKCLFCQNYQISWYHEGRPVSDEELAGMMIGLEAQGALNINLVSPTHVLLPVLRALWIAFREGLDIPLVWNSNGYESLEAVRRLDGIVDIFLPDLKYHSPEISRKYSGAADYFERAAPAVKEMYLQQPVLELGPDETAGRGLVIRHLILPGCVEDSLRILAWIRENLGPTIGLSLMSQYHPCHKAPDEIRRTLTREEYARAVETAKTLDLENIYIQPEPFSEGERLFPDFRRKDPFRWKEKKEKRPGKP